jgi:hypothetical protein
MPHSQNGWPVLRPESWLLYTWELPGGTRLRARNGSAGFLLMHLALWFDQRLEDLDEPLLDDWGHAYRPVRGYSTWSNHASGTAIDLNATDHPLAADHTFTQAEERAIHERLALYDGCIRWGGDYQTRIDAMHFELDRDLETCERVARRLLDSPRGRRILRDNPDQRKVILL